MTLAGELAELGCYLEGHFTDKRAGGYRHKIRVRFPDARGHEEAGEVIRRYFPQAEPVPRRDKHALDYVWKSPSGSTKGSGSSKEFQSYLRRRLAKEDQEAQVFETLVREIQSESPGEGIVDESRKPK